MSPNTLGTVCEITMGQAPDGDSYNTDGLGLPLLAGAGDFGETEPLATKFTTAPTKRCSPGDIILGIRASIGDKVRADRDYCLGRGVAGIRPSAAVDAGYLWHWLSSAKAELVRLARGATFKQVSRKDIAELSISLPRLEDQRRIAAILDRADALRAKRRAALAQLDTLTDAVFVEMFGDPVANVKQWPRLLLSDILTEIGSGRSPVCLDRSASNSEWGVLKLGAVSWRTFDATENKALPADVEPEPELEVKPNDLLFVRKNTYDLVGACVLVETTRPRLLLSDLIFRLELRADSGLEKPYLRYLLMHPAKRREIQRLAGGSAGSMPNISKARLMGVSIEMPPTSLQREFGGRAESIRRLGEVHARSLETDDALFASLQHRAFRGEL